MSKMRVLILVIFMSFLGSQAASASSESIGLDEFVTVEVISFFSPPTAVVGESVTFTWYAPLASGACQISGVPGLPALSPLSGTFSLTAATDLNAVVECYGNLDGQIATGTAYAELTVLSEYPPPTVTVSFAPNSIYVGQSTTFSWSSVYATQCSSTGGVSISGTHGSRTLSPQSNTTVTVTCTGPSGSATSSASVTVGIAPPTVSAFFFPAIPNVGDPVTLVWGSTGATSCNYGPTSGSIFFGIIYDFFITTVTCTGPGGSASSTAFVRAFPFAPNADVPVKAELAPSVMYALLQLGVNPAAEGTFTLSQDLNGDHEDDLLVYERKQQALSVIINEAGRFMAIDREVADVVDLSQLRNVEVRETTAGQREIRITLQR